MLPIALRTQGRRALLAGGGSVALRKAETLRDAGLHVHVVAPEIDPRIEEILSAHGTFSRRPYDRADAEGKLLAVAATNEPGVNARIVEDCRALHVLVCDATCGENSDFTMQATVRCGDLTFTVDSGGSTPAFSKRIAREIRERFGREYGDAARTLARMRTYVRTVVEEPWRVGVMRELAEMPVEELAAMNPIEAEHTVEATFVRLTEGGAAKRTSHIVCASRASALAMTQTRMVAARLAEAGIATTIVNVTTTGDRVQDRPLAAIGTVNVFVKELEVALREGRADYAVHSCKDLPGLLDADMRIAAISRREDPRDVFCSERFASFDALPAGAVVGTSSLRRRTQLEALRPDLCYKDIRGNVDTRLRKLHEGGFDAIVLAMAGLNRLRTRAPYTVPFETAVVVPAVAQGALAIETRATDIALAERLRDTLNDLETELCVACERAALRALRAGCNAPLGVHAALADRTMHVQAAFAPAAGHTIIRVDVRETVASIADAEALGERVAAALTDRAAPNESPIVVLARTQTRPSRLAAELRRRGVNVIEMHDGETPPLDRAPDMLVFPSSGSVDAAAEYLAGLRERDHHPVVAAMGPQSGDAARTAGFAPDIFAPEASIEAFVAVIAEHFGH